MSEPAAAQSAPPAWVDHATLAIAAFLTAFVVYTALAGEFSSDLQRGVPFAAIEAFAKIGKKHGVVK